MILATKLIVAVDFPTQVRQETVERCGFAGASCWTRMKQMMRQGGFAADVVDL
jgi:hypothetical protein